jgi:hypothetical protein
MSEATQAASPMQTKTADKAGLAAKVQSVKLEYAGRETFVRRASDDEARRQPTPIYQAYRRGECVIYSVAGRDAFTVVRWPDSDNGDMLRSVALAVYGDDPEQRRSATALKALREQLDALE